MTVRTVATSMPATNPAIDRLLKICPLSGRKVVDHGHPVAASRESVDQIRSDETGTAGDKAFHPGRSLERPGTSEAGDAGSNLAGPRPRYSRGVDPA